MKRGITALLALWMMLTVVGAAAVEHIHCACADSESCGSGHNASTTWMASSSLPESAGYFYLTNDVHISSVWEPVDGTTLCLNGYRIIYTGEGKEIIKIGSSKTFTLTDCADKPGQITGGYQRACTVEGTLNMYGGDITDNGFKVTGNTVGETVLVTGMFNLYGGRIIRNYATTAAVRISVMNSVMNMYGGEITQNTASKGLELSDYSGVQTNIYGGSISENNRGVYVAPNATLNMKGGYITRNRGSQRAGVTVAGTFNFSGGEITDNEATQGFAGVYVSENSVFKLSGSPVISGNLCKGLHQDVVIDKDAGSSMKLTGSFAPKKPIGVAYQSSENSITYGEGIVARDTADFSGYFFSAQSEYEVVYTANGRKIELKKAVAKHRHCVCTDGNICSDAHNASAVYSEWTKTDELPSERGTYYLSSSVNISQTWQPADGTVLCLNGKTITYTGENASAICIAANTDVVITDCGQGKITGGKAGAIDVRGKAELHQLKINGNSGGGVQVASGAEAWIRGGSITGNTAELPGAGVAAVGSVILSDDVIIRNNTVGGVESNLWLPTGKTVKADELVGCVGVTTQANVPVQITADTDSDYSSCFVSDDSDKRVVAQGSGSAQRVMLIAVAAEGHVHCFCVDAVTCGQAGHSASQQWQRWTDSGKLPDASGYYYLDCNVKLSQGRWDVPTGTFLCLNGHSIQGGGNVVEVHGEFTLTDCAENPGMITGGTGKWVNVQSSTTDFRLGGGVWVTGNGKFSMYGGRISGNTPAGVQLYCGYSGSSYQPQMYLYGGGISGNGSGVDLFSESGHGAKCEIYGGRISGNSGSGVVMGGGYVTMSGGEISGNRAYCGGGVYMNSHYAGILSNYFTMTGGVIRDNSADSNGGGVYVTGDKDRKSEFVMEGGTISGNSAAELGGGVGTEGPYQFKMTGGSIAGNTAGSGSGVYLTNAAGRSIEVGGTARVTGNSSDNVYLMRGDSDSKSAMLNLGSFRDGASIGVTSSVRPNETKKIPVSQENNTDYSKYFFSDNPAFGIIHDTDKRIKLTLSDEYTVKVQARPVSGGTVAGGGKVQPDTAQMSKHTVSARANEGFVFLYWEEGGRKVCETAQYTFEVYGHCTLTAVFGKDKPSALKGNVYDGSEKIGVEESDAYTIEGTAKAIDAGSYSATLTLADGCIWSDGTSDPLVIDWEIVKAKPDVGKVTCGQDILLGMSADEVEKLLERDGVTPGRLQLMGGADFSTPGTFEYQVLFVPVDSRNYESVPVSVALTVTAGASDEVEKDPTEQVLDGVIADLPQTGDESRIGAWMCLMVSCLAVVMMMRRRKA